MYSFDTRVRYSETDDKEKLTLLAILNYFQDCTTFQSEDLGIGLDQLKKWGCFWVLNYWQIDVYRYPRLCERIRVGTYPYACKGFIGSRNFTLDDEKGERLAAANSIWTYLSIEKGTPVHIPAEIIGAYSIDGQIEMEYEPRKIRIDGAIAGREEEPFDVKQYHLDANHHVNNGQYVKMAMDYLPWDFSVDRMRAEYRNAAYLGDRICPVVYESRDYTAVSLNRENGVPYTVVEFKCLN